MFRGVHHINLDSKGRLAVPVRQRESLLHDYDGRLIVTIDIQYRCLLIYPRREWEPVEDRIRDLPTLDRKTRDFQRMMLSHVIEIELDGSGRILLPAALREFANLGKRLVLLGQGTRMELWAEEQWQAESERALDQFGPDAVLPEALLSLRM